MPTRTLRALLAGLIDYAGLFPPAGLPLAEVARHYDAYRRSPDAWALGHLVVPAARLEELSDLVAASGVAPLLVSALIGDDLAGDGSRIQAAATRGHVIVDAVEARASTATAVDNVMREFGEGHAVYVEIPVADDPWQLVKAIAQSGGRAKIRSGGVVPEAFPTAAQCARFILRCAELGVSFKATAGLHHPLRGNYSISYAADAPRTTMFGFVHLFVAAAFARTGVPQAMIEDVLEERDPGALEFTDDGLAWRGHSLSRADVVAARTSFALAFGSCSFREPIDELTRLGLL